jgi:DNA-binding XRE family transcriptional regulator
MKIRELIEKLEISQREAARLIGISDRTMRRYCSENDPDEAPKPVIMALNCLLEHGNVNNN